MLKSPTKLTRRNFRLRSSFVTKDKNICHWRFDVVQGGVSENQMLSTSTGGRTATCCAPPRTNAMVPVKARIAARNAESRAVVISVLSPH